MAAPTNTTTTLVSIGNAEDVEDKIYRVAPEETPFMSQCARVTANAVTHEWQTETLAAPSATTQALEGDVMTLVSPNLTTRLGNVCQINRKDYGVSATEQAVKKYGRSNELVRQAVLHGIEARRDAEARFIGNYATVTESGATARKSGGALAAITSNTSLGSGGSNGGISGSVWTAATNGTQRSLTETLLKAVLSAAFTNGAKPSVGYMGPTQKQEFSQFTGIASIRVDAGSKGMARIVGGADVYESDFGKITAVPHPYGLTRDVLLTNPTFWKIAVLRGWKTKDFAMTSDGMNQMIAAEHTLVAANEKSSAAIRDLS